MKDFVHLHVHTDYSLLDGAASIKKLVARAKELGQTALAITDHGNMFGVLRFWQECKDKDIKPLIGCEFYVAPEGRTIRKGTENGNRYYHLILIAKDETGYRNLMKLSSISYIEGMYYKPRIDFEVLKKHHQGLVCLTACLAGELPVLLLEKKEAQAQQFIADYKALFGEDSFYIEVQDHGIEEQKTVAKLLIDIAQKTNTPMVVTNDIHYTEKQDYISHDILLCVGTQRKRNEQNRLRYYGQEFYLKDGDQMAELFPSHPEMLSNTVKIAQMCNVEIPQPGPILPIYEIPPEFKTKEDYFRYLVFKGLEKRYGEITAVIKERAEFELSTIISMDFVGYFLIVWDFIKWAKEHEIPVGPGRGSGAGSIVAYAIEITDIDPIRFNLLFERFLNPERVSMPDFDVDFCNEGREEVIEYVQKKYGEERVAQIITFGTMKPKAALKDVGRVLEVPLSDVNKITKQIPNNPKVHLKDAFTVNQKIQGSGLLSDLRDDPQFKELFDISFKLENTNRNSSLHASGLVIGREPLTEYVPLYKDAKTQKIATQFTMDIIEPCGLVKMDFLGLKTLTLIKYAEKLIQKRGGQFANFKVNKVSETDEATYKMLGEGKSAGVFQFESQGMQNILKQVKPNRLEDLIALNALYRPGPMGYIPQFVESKFDNSKIKYPHECLKEILEETYGVIVYQEQVMQVAQKIAGYSLGKADMLRRAMGKKKIDVMKAEKESFVKGALENGFSADKADEIFEILIPFAGYGFNKSHAAAYSLVAYHTAYLKANFPSEFIAANLTNEINSTDKLPQYINEGRAMGLTIDPPDVNRSDKLFTVVDGKIVYGLMGIKGLGEAAAEEIINERNKNGHYSDFMDFLDRVNLSTVTKRALEALVQTGSFDNLGDGETRYNRATLEANMERVVEYVVNKKKDSTDGQMSLFDETEEKIYLDFAFEKQEDLPQLEKLRIEKELIGFYISGHPLDTYKKAIERSSTFSLQNIDLAQKEKSYTIIAMIRSIRALQTKTGRWMAFGAIEDYNGVIDLTIFSDVWERDKDKLVPESIWGFVGKIDFSRETPSLVVSEIVHPDSLQEKSYREIHIELMPNFTNESQLAGLKDILFDQSSGNCSVIFHLALGTHHYLVRTNNQLSVPSSDDFISQLESIPLIDSVWKE
ncbi:MAG: DNA polymerase III subunit alpha [Treponemataceae bacterium]